MKAHLILGDVAEVLKAAPDNSFDAVLCDPPYGLAFMGKRWDYDVPSTELWAEVLRVCKPGAPLIAFFGTRTYHRGVVRIEDAGFEVRDQINWLYGSGFPKSHDVSKAIDKQRHDREEILKVTAWIREARDAAGVTNKQIDDAFGFVGMSSHWTSRDSQPTVPALEQVPTLLAVLKAEPPDEIRRLLVDLNTRKGEPGEAWKSAEVVGEYETMPPGLVGHQFTRRDALVRAPNSDLARQWNGYGTALKPALEPAVLARKPLEGTVADNVRKWGVGGLAIDATRLETKAASFEDNREAKHNDVYGKFNPSDYDGSKGRWPSNVIVDEAAATFVDAEAGDVSRFFYCAKASKKDRGAGNTHPTVKPVALTTYLAKMILPPTPGRVLVPFAGSGSEMIGALKAGWPEVVGIEREREYIEIAARRLGELGEG